MLESDDLLFKTPNLSPELRLWFACLIHGIENLRERRFGDNTPAKQCARDFIFEDHIGFIWLCDSLGYDPEAMRRRVEKALTASQDAPGVKFKAGVEV